jgi:hypothetical protein
MKQNFTVTHGVLEMLAGPFAAAQLKHAENGTRMQGVLNVTYGHKASFRFPAEMASLSGGKADMTGTVGPPASVRE